MKVKEIADTCGLEIRGDAASYQAQIDYELRCAIRAHADGCERYVDLYAIVEKEIVAVWNSKIEQEEGYL